MLKCFEDVIRYLIKNHDGTRKYWKVCYKVQSILFLFPCQVHLACHISVVNHGKFEVMYAYLYSRISGKLVRAECTSLGPISHLSVGQLQLKTLFVCFNFYHV
jgi:hypothetical protein